MSGLDLEALDGTAGPRRIWRRIFWTTGAAVAMLVAAVAFRLQQRLRLDKQITIHSTTGAGHQHYVDGMARLSAIKAAFGDVLERTVTTKLPHERFAEGFAVGGPDHVKTVLEF